MNQNTGGPAFPMTASTGDPRDGVYCQNGMTLLDWMAGQALAGLMTSERWQINHKACSVAYDQAALMLAEKARRESPPTERISIGADDKRKAFEAFKLLGSINHPEFDAVRLAIAKLTSRFEVEKDTDRESSTTDHFRDAAKMIQDHSPDAGNMVRREVYAESVMLRNKAWNKIDKLEALNREFVEALKALLARDQRNTCQHEETHRGGVLWEICDNCKVSWADDEGGKPAWSDPPEWVAAKTVLSKAKEVA